MKKVERVGQGLRAQVTAFAEMIPTLPADEVRLGVEWWARQVGTDRVESDIDAAIRELRKLRVTVGAVTATCASCGSDFVPLRSDARHCSNACRQRAYRERLSPGDRL